MAQLVKFTNLKQRYSWDCGLTCIEIITRALDNTTNKHDTIYNMVTPGNVWTIDLAFVLKQLGMDFTFYTILAGVNIEYSGVDFYKAALAQEAPRVNKLFEDAKHAGMKVETRSVEIEVLKEHVQRGNPSIVLVDNRCIEHVSTLHATPSVSPSPSLAPTQLTPTLDTAGYQGHYILVCGYNKDSDQFEYCDPTYHQAITWKLQGEVLELMKTCC